jgi:hypothetical protein
MSGYREHRFDPNAGGDGRPLRPFNGLQWTGVGFTVAAGVMLVAVVASAAGLISPAFEHNAGLAGMMSVVGAILINSRREFLEDPAPELAQARKRWLLIAVLVCAVIIGAAVAIEFTGA